jgi:predicted ATPase
LDLIYDKSIIGRDKELAELKKIVDKSLSGEGQVVFTVGERGVGKTHFWNAFWDVNDYGNLVVIDGDCHPSTISEPYFPFKQALNSYFKKGDVQPDVKKAVKNAPHMFLKIVPEAEAYVSLDMVGDTGGLQQERDKLFDIIGQVLLKIAQDTPLVVSIGNMQWIDKTSMQLFHYIARNIQYSPVLLIGTYDQTSLDEETTSTIRLMSRERLTNTIALGRFNRGDTKKFLSRLLTYDVPDVFSNYLFERTDGNPKYLTEIIDMMTINGIIDLEKNKYPSHTELSEISIPVSVLEILYEKLKLLKPEDNDILNTMAILGNIFEFEMAIELLEMEEDELLERVERLVHLGLVEESEKGDFAYRFESPMAHDVIYSLIAEQKKQELHRKAGELIEEKCAGQLEEHAYDLARHFYNGTVWDKAVEYSIKAGKQAEEVYAAPEALGYYKQCLEALENLEGNGNAIAMKLEALEKCGEMCFHLGEWDEAIGYYNKVIEIAKKTNNKVILAKGFYHLGEILEKRSEYEKALDVLEKGLTIFEDVKDWQGTAECYREIGRIFKKTGQLDDAVETLKKGIDIADGLADKALLGRIYDDLGSVHTIKGNYRIAEESYRKSIELLEESNDQFELGRALNNIGDLYLKMKYYKKALGYFEKLIVIAKDIDWNRGGGWGYVNAAEALAKLGGDENLACAEEYCQKALRISEKLGEKYMVASSYVKFALTYTKMRDWKKAIEHFEKAIKYRKEANVPYYIAQDHFEFGMMYRDKSDVDKAMEQVQEAKKIWQEIGSKERLDEANRILLELKEV